LNDKSSDLKHQQLSRPTLTAVRASNFRNRLYHQLNVVKRSPRKPSYLGKCPLNSLMMHSTFAFANGSRGEMRSTNCEFERSEPLSIGKKRMNDVDFEDHNRKRSEEPTTMSQEGSDNEDVFALDM